MEYVLLRANDDPPVKEDGQPVVESDAERDQRERERRDRKANDARLRMWMLQKCSADAKALIRDKPTAYLMMETLRRDFDQRTVASQVKAIKELLTIRFKEGGNMEQHCALVHQSIENVKRYGPLEFDTLHKVILLMSMQNVESYESLITVLTSQEGLTVEQVRAQLLDRAANARSASWKENDKAAAFSARASESERNDGRSNIKCYRCGKGGHFKRDCNLKYRSTEEVKKGDKGPSSRASEGHQGGKKRVSFLMVASGAILSKDEWLEDSGASELFTNRRDVFHTFTPSTGSVTVGNEAVLPITGSGVVKFKSTCSDGSVCYLEFNFKLSEELAGNLMSMGELDRLGIVTQSEKGKKRYFFEGEEVMTATLQD